MGKDPDYFRRKAKENYEYNKKISDLYRSDKNITEPFSEFKNRIKKTKNPF